MKRCKRVFEYPAGIQNVVGIILLFNFYRKSNLNTQNKVAAVMSCPQSIWFNIDSIWCDVFNVFILSC